MKRELSGLKLEVGQEAPYFNLPATDGKRYSLNDFTASKALAVVFTCNHCPYVKAWDDRLLGLIETFSQKGLSLIAICSNDSIGYPQDAFEQMVKKSEAHNFSYPYLHDETQEVAKAYDAACTPEVYLFNSDQKLCYHGRIDDNHSDPESVAREDLKIAIAEVIEGKDPVIPLTPAMGCSIKWKA